MKRVLVVTTTIVVISLISYVLVIFLAIKFGRRCTCYGLQIDGRCAGIKTMCFGILPNIPISNLSREEATQKIRFNDTILKIGDIFNFSPESNCGGDIKARLANIYNDGIMIEILEEQVPGGWYREVKPYKNVTVKDGVCISAIPICMDVIYNYCFSLDNTSVPHTYSYKIKTTTTMPLPSSK